MATVHVQANTKITKSSRSCFKVDANISQTTNFYLHSHRRQHPSNVQWRTTTRFQTGRAPTPNTPRLCSTRQRIRNPTIQWNQQSHCQKSSRRRRKWHKQCRRRTRQPLAKEAQKACHTWKRYVSAETEVSLILAVSGITGIIWPWESNNDLTIDGSFFDF